MTSRKFEDIIMRRKVWLAMSELYLDTDTSVFFDDIVEELAKSPYSIKELQHIMLYEVYPVCRWNLFSIAGEWAGFDEEWLVNKICKEPTLLTRIWTHLIGKLSITSFYQWRKIIKKVRSLRKENSYS